MANKLLWSEEYSVNVKELDAQHQQIFSIINELIEQISKEPNEEKIKQIIARILDYKKYHFTTEEKYFSEFGFEGAIEHEEKHRLFNAKIDEITKSGKDTVGITFDLIDFLEDWLVEHIMTVDRKYIKCFNEHGLF